MRTVLGHTSFADIQVMARRDIHTVPVGDLIEHEETEDCVCGPRCDPVTRPDGSMGFVYIHHSLDGREMYEEDGA